MTGYLIRKDTPEQDVVINGRPVHLYPGWSYLEWIPYERAFTWLASSSTHATVFSREAADAQAAILRATEPADVTIRVVEDYALRAPQFTELPQAEGVRRVG